MSLPSLSSGESRRYLRHLTLPEVGPDGQKKLKASAVLVVGAGGLGSPIAMYLAAAGVGKIGLVDYDVVDETNLQRQLLHGTRDVGRKKLDSACDRLRDINPHVTVEPHPVRLDSHNALDIIANYDVVADGTDNFPTRYLVNDACVIGKKPNVYGSVFRFEGQVSVFAHPRGPCYRCVHPTPPPPGLVPSCAEGGVLGALPGLIGTLQAAEVLKLLLHTGSPLLGRLLLVDILDASFRSLTVRRDGNCAVCGSKPTITRLIDYQSFCGLPPVGGRADVPYVTVTELKALRDAGRGPFVLDVRKPYEAEIASLGADQLIPVGDLRHRLREVRASPHDTVVVHCRSGGRSAQAVRLLSAAGFAKAVNLEGGILAWSDKIDPSVPRY